MYVEIVNEQKAVAIDSAQVANIIASVIVFEGQRCDEVAVHFVSCAEITDLHARFFDDPTPTDCISLPIDEEDDGSYRHLGEVFVCPEVACDYVTQHGGNAYEETILYTIHGLLHLMGYDDLSPEEEQAMRIAEKKHLDRLKLEGMLTRS